MRVLFYRNTHDENGNYRGDEYFGRIDIFKRIKDARDNGTELSDKDINKFSKYNREFESQQLFFGVHTLREEDGMTFDEIYKETFNMLRGGALDGTIEENEESLSIEHHLRALAFMIKHKLVKAKIRY